MADKAVIDATTGQWLRGPLPEDFSEELPQGQTLIDVDGGYPDTAGYDPVARAFYPKITVTRQRFMDLFSLEEKLAVLASDDIRVKLAVMETQAADTIRLYHPKVLDGLDLFIEVNILTPERSAQIQANILPE